MQQISGRSAPPQILTKKFVLDAQFKNSAQYRLDY